MTAALESECSDSPLMSQPGPLAGAAATATMSASIRVIKQQFWGWHTATQSLMPEDRDVQPGMHFMLRRKADAIWYLVHAKPHDC